MRSWIEAATPLADAQSRTLRAIHAALDPRAPDDYRWLAAWLATRWSEAPPARVGLGGGQGAGKSTLGRLLQAAVERTGRRAVLLSLDDFYRTRAERRALAERVHPLLETRGPPGTHDSARLSEALEALGRPGRVSLPVFDKGRDDRRGEQTVEGPFEVIVLEGWCVGARPLPPAGLAAPINALEREQDADGRWRRFVAERLASDYEPLWSGFDAWLQLRVPSLAAVRRWRLAQEAERPRDQRLDEAMIDRFVQHYERLTLAMLDQAPRAGELRVELDEEHAVRAVEEPDVVAEAGR